MAADFLRALPMRAALLRRGALLLLAIAIVSAGAVSPAAAGDRSDEVFNTAVVSDVWLEIPNPSWTPIDDVALSACERHHRSYHPGTVRIGSMEYPGSGVRVKGGCGSSRTLEEKAAFKANLSWDDPNVPGCPELRTYKGIKKFTLNNQVEDASFTHERIGYHFFQKLGVPVPRVGPVRLHVNGRLWGLYLNVETIDRRFLARHFDSSEGMLYEADYGCDIGEESCFEPKFDTDACDEPREGGDPTDMTPLRALNARLAQLPADDFYPAIDRIFNFDLFLTTWAAASVMGYWDGYPNDANNYRIYHDPTDDRWTVIPTGTDQLFENKIDPFDPIGKLATRCLAEQDCRAAFRSRLAEVLELFESSGYAAKARAIENQIRADVEADPRKEITVSEWHAAVSDTVAYIQTRPGEVRGKLSTPERAKPRKDFYFRVFTEEAGDQYVFASWLTDSGADTAAETWLTAKGPLKGLDSEFDVIETVGGSFEGSKVGTMTVSFVDCQTAQVHFQPDQSGLPPQTRTASVDSAIWKYCD
jgi:hypothetical protein